ncbi:hypothetical protein Scep_018804 [Stephania cephalantha]|uniref:Uncharacterized protein n=1 Tax=Stephania cephalantha TaxID=152367 RepID=A0AAP0I9V8_9MAGN
MAEKVAGGGNGGNRGARKGERGRRCSADGVAFTRGDQRRRKTITRTGGATRGVVGVRCRGMREPAESRSMSTMTVDDDGDGGGEDCAVRRWRRGQKGLRERGTRRMGFGFTSFFYVATDRDRSSLSPIVCRRSYADHRETSLLDQLTDLFQALICRKSVTTLAGEISDRSVTTYNLSQFLSQIIL